MDWYTFVQQTSNTNAQNNNNTNNPTPMNIIDQKYNWQILCEQDIKDFLTNSNTSPLGQVTSPMSSPSASPTSSQENLVGMGMGGMGMNNMNMSTANMNTAQMNAPMNSQMNGQMNVPMNLPMNVPMNMMYQLPGSNLIFVSNGVQSGSVTTSNAMVQPYSINTSTANTSPTPMLLPKTEQAQNQHQFQQSLPSGGNALLMESFPTDQVRDFKHVIYNLLVLNHNNQITKMVNCNSHSDCNFIQPCNVKDQDGLLRSGFKFNESMNPEKRLPEIYAQHVRKAKLEDENQSSVLIQDLYKYYMRACVELLGKYFEKVDKYTYLYDDIPLFTPNGSLADAAKRIKSMKTRARRRCTT